MRVNAWHARSWQPAAADRIGVVHLVSELAHGGTESVLFDLLSRLDPERYAVTVATTGGRDAPEVRWRFQSAGLDVVRLPCRLPGHAGRGFGGRHIGLKAISVAALAAYLRAARPCIVHAHGPANHLYGALAARLAGVPRVLVHDHNPLGCGWRDRVAARAVARLADAACGVSRYVAASRRALLGSHHGRVVVLANGVDVQRFRPPSAGERTAARRRLGVPESAYVFGSVARLVDFKHHDLAVGALAEMQARVPEAHLLLAGEGPEADALRARARARGVERRVTIAGWQADSVPAHWALDVFVTMSDGREGFGLAAAEALACGRAVVARRGPLSSEVLAAAERVQPEPAALAAALAALACAEARARAGIAARRHALAHLDARAAAARLADLYAALVPAAAQGRAA